MYTHDESLMWAKKPVFNETWTGTINARLKNFGSFYAFPSETITFTVSDPCLGWSLSTPILKIYQESTVFSWTNSTEYLEI